MSDIVDKSNSSSADDIASRWTAFGSASALDHLQKEVFPMKSPQESPDDMTPKANRVAMAVGKGFYDGAAEDIQSIVNSPNKLLPAIELGLGITAASVLAPEIAAVTVFTLPVFAIGSAALELAGHAKEVTNAIGNAWNGEGSLQNCARELRPLGHFALTYAVARGTTRVSYPALNVASDVLGKWKIR